jgi:hypothetical protein
MARGDKTQGYFSGTARIPDVGHLVRLVILGKSREEQQPRLILVTNRTTWEVKRVVRVYG